MMDQRSSPFLLLLLLLASTAPSQAQCPQLIWSDEFDGDQLDATKWTPQIGDGSTLGDDLIGWGNNELQYYRRENIEVSQGTLKIHARQENFQNWQYTSARIRSLGLFDVDLASGANDRLRLEARIKVPAGMGLWSAFWMLNSQTELTTWPIGGEIDIMEHIGREPFKVRTYVCCLFVFAAWEHPFLPHPCLLL